MNGKKKERTYEVASETGDWRSVSPEPSIGYNSRILTPFFIRLLFQAEPTQTSHHSNSEPEPERPSVIPANPAQGTVC